MTKLPLNTPQKRETAWETIKDAFNCFTETKIGEGLGKLVSLGGATIKNLFQGVGNYFGIDILKNPNLKFHQKILPFIGVALAGFVAIPISILTVFVASIFVPPLVLVGAAVGLFKDVSLLIRDITERNNLRKELYHTDTLIMKINKTKKLSDLDRTTIESYLNQREIYEALYDMRKNIMTSHAISKEEKISSIGEINSLIESFYRGEKIEPSYFEKLNAVKYLDKDKISHAKRVIQEHNLASDNIENIKISKSLMRKIKDYKATKNKVYAQDIPFAIKEKLIDMTEGKKINRNEMKTLYASIGNHFVSSTTRTQLDAQDASIDKKILKHFTDKNDREMIKDFYKTPIRIHQALESVILHLEEHQQDSPEKYQFQRQNIQQIMKYLETSLELKGIHAIVPEWDMVVADLKKNGVNLTQLDGIRADLVKLSTSHEPINILFDKAQASIKVSSGGERNLGKLKNLKERVFSHRTSTLSQYAAGAEFQFASPKLESDYGQYDLFQQVSSSVRDSQVGKIVKEKSGEKFASTSKSFKDKLIEALFGEEGLKKRQEYGEAKAHFHEKQTILQEDFENRYKGTFELIEKAERLSYLEKSVPRRAVNVGIHLGVIGLSVGSTILLPVLASPGAPVSVALSAIMGVASTTFSFAAIGNSLGLGYQAANAKEKTDYGKDESILSAGPAPEYHEKMHRKADKKAERKIKKIEKQHAKETVQTELGADKKSRRIDPIVKVFGKVKENIPHRKNIEKAAEALKSRFKL